MAGNETDLANAALGEVGEDPIVDLFDPADRRANICRRQYERARDATLRAAPWNSAARVSPILAPVANNLTEEWGYAHVLPTDPYCIRVRRIITRNNSVYRREFEPAPAPFRIIGRVMYSNQAEPRILYTARLSNVGEYDDLLWDAIATRLAAYIAWPIVRNFTLGRELLQLAILKDKEASAVNSVEGGGAVEVSTPRNIVTVR